MAEFPGDPSLDPGADQAGFPGLGDPAADAVGSGGAYRVLARKYRPQTFADLIGQDAMVRTLRNAFATSRIPQAWMLTGVRGVGKTTTARILARALNYDRGDGRGGPTVEMPEPGLHCRSIMESRHVDVMEIDAASHTGVENVRQITDGVRYGPAQARYKVYIVDEVHMLSTAAFNAFLKTLEEPPPHAKFVFATTEIRKVPVTVLSRCQRFDLRRVETGTLQAHLARICSAEEVAAEPEALGIIARAAEGSVRDALSLLDQAVAHGAGQVAAAAVSGMLGLAQRGQVIDLFEAAMRGDMPACFALLRQGWDRGVDPALMLSDLAAFTHTVTRLKLAPEAARDPALTEAERVRGAAFAAGLSVRALSRAWQILLKALPEVGSAARPLAAAEMALVRLAYAADLPTPDEALRALRAGPPPAGEARPLPDGRSGPETRAGPEGQAGPENRPALSAEPAPNRPAALVQVASGGGPARAAVPCEASAPDASPTLTLRRFTDVVALAGERREIGLKAALEREVRPVAFEEGRIELALTETASPSLPNDLSRLLSSWTGRRWVVVVSRDGSDVPTIDEARRRREHERRSDATTHPLVQAVLRSFPGAEIVDVRERAPTDAADVPAPGDGEVADEA